MNDFNISAKIAKVAKKNALMEIKQRKVPKFLFIGIFACLFSFYAYSHNTSGNFSAEYKSATDFFSADIYNQLCEVGSVRNFSVFQEKANDGSKNEVDNYISNTLKYLPDLPEAKKNVVAWSKNHSYTPNYILENVYRFPLDEKSGFVQEKREKNAEFEKINLLVRAFSKMEGLKYYSNSRHKMDTLYKKCYTLDNSIDKNRIDDVTDLSKNPLYVLFDDNSFGVYIGEIRYGQAENEIHITEINQNSLGLPGLKVIKPNDMTAFIDIIPCKDEILVYVLIEAKVNVANMFKNMIYDSFIARSDAIFDWIKDSYIGE